MRNEGSSVIRLLIGVAMAVFALISYFASQQFNPVTGEQQHLSLTPRQEIALGLQSAPELIQAYGGLEPDDSSQNRVDSIGLNIVNSSIAQETPWQFEFHVLDDNQTINAFALPGGQVFITQALLDELESDQEIAGVMAHEIVHVLARHSAQQLAQNQLTNGLVGAVAVASDSANAAQTAAVIGQLVNMSYSRDHELQSDTLGVCLMIQSGYDPEAMVQVMQVLAAANQGASPPEFFSTHPDPGNRIQQIRDAIASASEECPTELQTPDAA